MMTRLYSFPKRQTSAPVKSRKLTRPYAGVVIELAQYWRMEWGLF